jgi:hypothetical protein
MEPTSPRDDHRTKQLMRRFDRMLGQMNMFLFAVVIGLGLLYVTCLLTLLVRLPVTHLEPCRVSTSSTAGDGASK